MTSLRRHELERALQHWDAAVRLLLLGGPDESGVRAAAALAVAALADAADPLSLSELTPEQLAADPGALADEAAAISMFGGRRAIRVSGAGEAVGTAVQLLLAAPVAGNPVIMLAGNLARTSNLRKLAEKSPLARLVLCYPLEGRALAGWLRTAAAARGLVLTRQVAERLLQATDGDIAILDSELDKFQLFLGATPDHRQRLDGAAWLALGADSAEEDIGALVAAVVAGDAAATERQLRLLEGSSAIPALRALARRLVQMLEARAAIDAGASAAAAVRGLRPPVYPFSAQDALAAALPHWPQPRIRRALQQMLAAERAIKQPASPGDAPGWQAILALGLGGRAR